MIVFPKNIVNVVLRTIGGEGNGTPLQCSYLENPMDGGAWWAAVYAVAQIRSRLKRLSSSSSNDRSWVPAHSLLAGVQEVQWP